MNVMDQPKKWENSLPLVAFSYNNGFLESLNMISFEALYGVNCNNPIKWDYPLDRVTLWLDMLEEMDQELINIKYKLKVTQDW